MTLRYTLFFNDPDYISGWTETYYGAGAGISSVTIASLMSLAQARAGLLDPSFQISFGRIGLLLPQFNPPPFQRRQRAAFLQLLEIPGASQVPGGGDLPQTAAVIRFTGVPATLFSIRMLRGVPDALWGFNNDTKARQVMQAFIPDFLIALTAGGFGWFSNNRSMLTFTAFNLAYYERMSKRATGRPSFLPVGRR